MILYQRHKTLNFQSFCRFASAQSLPIYVWSCSTSIESSDLWHTVKFFRIYVGRLLRNINIFSLQILDSHGYIFFTFSIFGVIITQDF